MTSILSTRLDRRSPSFMELPFDGVDGDLGCAVGDVVAASHGLATVISPSGEGGNR